MIGVSARRHWRSIASRSASRIGFCKRAEHLQALRLADLLRRREHALIHAACDQHLRLAAALAEIAQQLDAIGAGHLQIQHHDGRLKILHGPPKRVRLRHRERFEAETGRRPRK